MLSAPVTRFAVVGVDELYDELKDIRMSALSVLFTSIDSMLLIE